MKSIHGTIHGEFIIRKSRFIGILAPASSFEEVVSLMAAIRTDHPGATHVCYAYILGQDGLVQRASDDGEPQKTAGFPMLEILKKNNLTDIVAVVVRYFGGIKLGAGGLIRAYANAIRDCVKQAVLSIPESFDECRIVVPYTSSGMVETFLRSAAELTDQHYGSVASYQFFCPSNQTAWITEEIKKRTGSGIEAEIVRSVIRYR